MPQPLRWLSMLLPFALWGTAMAAMRPLLDGASPSLVAALRILPAGLALLVAAALLGRDPVVDRQDRPWLLLFALVDATLFQGLLTRGLAQTGAGLGSVLIDSQPLLVALLARVLFAEAINPVGWLGLLIGLLGILCLGLPPAVLRHWWLEGPLVLGERAWSHGELWMLGAAAAMAVGTVLSRYACRRSDALIVTGWHLLLGGLPLLLLPRSSGPARAIAGLERDPVGVDGLRLAAGQRSGLRPLLLVRHPWRSHRLLRPHLLDPRLRPAHRHAAIG
jgi:drug/metabolite transporter (DMT)-like permease